MSSTSAKLVELRRKTDQELWLVIQRELDRGLTLASVASAKQSPLRDRAERIYNSAKSLLNRLDHAGRARLEARLKELRTALDQVPAERPARPMMCSAQGD